MIERAYGYHQFDCFHCSGTDCDNHCGLSQGKPDENRLPAGDDCSRLLIFLRLLPSLSLLFDSFSTLSERAGVSSDYLSLLLKIIGLAYLAEFGAQLCRDAGEGAAALKIEFAAKITILLLALPLIASVIQAVLRLLD